MKKQFFATVEIPATENECFGISFPDFPYCFSASDTVQDIHKNAKQAIEEHIKIANIDLNNLSTNTFLSIEDNVNKQDYSNKMVIIIEAEI